jgi:hypothetical protein
MIDNPNNNNNNVQNLPLNISPLLMTKKEKLMILYIYEITKNELKKKNLNKKILLKIIIIIRLIMILPQIMDTMEKKQQRRS